MLIETNLAADPNCIVDAFREIVGDAHVLTKSDDVAAYLTDWTGQYSSDALAVVRPASTEDVAALIKLCKERNIAVVPQGGRTGLCGGGVPIEGRESVVVSLARMNAIRTLNPQGRTVIAEAGVILETLHEAALQEGSIHEEALGMIASAKRPLVLAGAGAVGAKDKLIALSERLEAPLATTLKGTGLFKGHPNNIGYFGTLSTAEAYDVIGVSDCVIVFGALMHILTTDRGELLKGKRVIQVNNYTSDVGRFYQPDATLIADAAQTADNFLYWLNEAEVAPSGFANELPSHDISVHPKGDPAKSTQGLINLEYALDRLNETLPEDRIMLTDGGCYITEVWCRVNVPDPNSFHMSDNFAAIGQGMQQAIGAAHGAPNRPVVLFMGEGGFMMGGINEFNTAVRTNRDLIVIICNDSAYGAEHIQMLDRKMDPKLTEFDWPSFRDVANSLGGQGVEVTSPEDLEVAIEAINARTGPIIFELKLDPNNVPRMRI